jgi:hypothetical protein
MPAYDWYVSLRGDLSATVARGCIAETWGLPIESVEVWDRLPRQGVYDLRCVHLNRVIAVEAKLVMDEDLERMLRRIERLGFRPDLRLARRWTVVLRHGTDVRAAIAELPDVLARMEAHGWVDRLGYGQARRAGFADDFDSRGITGTWSTPTRTGKASGFVLRSQAVWAFPEALPDLSAFVSDLFADETSGLVRDLRRQLSTGSDADERHAFLVIGHEYPHSWQLSRCLSRDLPSEPPRLPAPINGVWLASFAADSRVLACLPTLGWIVGRHSCSSD